MRTLARVLGAFVSAVAAFYFMYWVGGAILAKTNVPSWICFPIAVLTALLAARYTWVQTRLPQSDFFSSIALGAVLTGSVCFSIGFFGPFFFAPEANEGPVLGLLITGPLGAIVGALGGAVYWLVRSRRRTAPGTGTE